MSVKPPATPSDTSEESFPVIVIVGVVVGSGEEVGGCDVDEEDEEAEIEMVDPFNPEATIFPPRSTTATCGCTLQGASVLQ
jgi:hypothetical protein